MAQPTLNRLPLCIVRNRGLLNEASKRGIGSIRRNISNSKRSNRLRDSKERDESLHSAIPPNHKGSLKGSSVDVSSDVVEETKVDVSTIDDKSALARTKRGPIDPWEGEEPIKEFRKGSSSLYKLSNGVTGEIPEPKVRKGVKSGLIISIDKGERKLVGYVNIRGNVEEKVLPANKGNLSKIFRRLRDKVKPFNSLPRDLLELKKELIMVSMGIFNVADETMSAKEKSDPFSLEVKLKLWGSATLARR